MATKPPQAMERLLPMFHGQCGQILAYVAAQGSATPDEIRKDLTIPRSTVYKLLNECLAFGLVTKQKEGKLERISVPDFVFDIKNMASIDELRLTPRNILAFDSAHTPGGRMFIERHGLGKFARFVQLYDDYERGRITSQVMARELGVIRYEIEMLLSDIRALMPVALEIRHPRSR